MKHFKYLFPKLLYREKIGAGEQSCSNIINLFALLNGTEPTRYLHARNIQLEMDLKSRHTVADFLISWRVF